MIPINKVKDLISKHKLLENDLSAGAIDKKKFAEKSKEYSDLNDIISEAKSYSSFESEKRDQEKIINDKKSDKEIKDLAQIELEQLVKKNEINEKKNKNIFIAKGRCRQKKCNYRN